MKRRNFVQGLALGAGVGTLGAMGAYSRPHGLSS